MTVLLEVKTKYLRRGVHGVPQLVIDVSEGELDLHIGGGVGILCVPSHPRVWIVLVKLAERSAH